MKIREQMHLKFLTRWIFTKWLWNFLETRYQNVPMWWWKWLMSQLRGCFLAWAISSYIFSVIMNHPCYPPIVVLVLAPASSNILPLILTLQWSTYFLIIFLKYSWREGHPTSFLLSLWLSQSVGLCYHKTVLDQTNFFGRDQNLDFS